MNWFLLSPLPSALEWQAVVAAEKNKCPMKISLHYGKILRDWTGLCVKKIAIDMGF